MQNSHSETASRCGARPVLITGGVVLDVSDASMRRADILIENGAIARIAGHGEINSISEQTLNASGWLILPGFTTAHTHSPENLAGGFCDGLQLPDWLKAVWRHLDRLPPEAIRLAVYWGAAEMLKRGVTAVVDHFRQTPMSVE